MALTKVKGGVIADGSATLTKLDTTGSTGQVLTAQGSGVAPIWAAAAESGSTMEYIAHGVQLGINALAFTSIPSGYATFYLYVHLHGANNRDFQINLSSDNGTTYGSNRAVASTGNDSVASGWVSISNVSASGTSKACTARISGIEGIANANTRTVVTYTNTSTETGVTGVINALRVSFNGANVSSTVTLYGVK